MGPSGSLASLRFDITGECSEGVSPAPDSARGPGLLRRHTASSLCQVPADELEGGAEGSCGLPASEPVPDRRSQHAPPEEVSTRWSTGRIRLQGTAASPQVCQPDRRVVEAGDLSRPLPEEAEVAAALAPGFAAPSSNISSVAPYGDIVRGLLYRGVEMVAIHQQLVYHHGYGGSYSSVRRFVGRLRPKTGAVVVRVETPPGQEAQVDFGGAGPMRDPRAGRLRLAYCFVMTLSYSRRHYVEFVFDQKMET